MSGPLAGLKVVDVSIMAAGPWAGALLGQLGAHVIKVEPPAGDGTRWVEPLQYGMGTNFICLNVNKEDVILDLKNPTDHAILVELVKDCDIFLQNFRGGVIDRLGLGWSKLQQVNSRLIYCSISGFGEVGKLARAGAADYVVQAYSGFASLNGHPGSNGEQFRFSGFIDLTTSSVALEGILAALLRREQTGKGQKIELSMLEAAVEMQGTRLAELLLAGVSPKASGSFSTRFAPDGAFETLDNPVFVTVKNDTEWIEFAKALGLPDLAADHRFLTNHQRVRNVAALDEIISPVFKSASATYWLRAFERRRIAAGVAHNFETFRHHLQVTENGLIEEMDTKRWGHVVVGGLPWRFQKTPASIYPPSAPGENTEEICAPIRGRLSSLIESDTQ